MAIPDLQVNLDALDNPVWPDHLPNTATMRMLYGEEADELVVHFVNERHRHPVYVLIATPDYDYAAGEVIGAMVYPLAVYAVEWHPAWQAATEPNPDSSVAVRIVGDIKNLFDQYGIETGSDEQN